MLTRVYLLGTARVSITVHLPSRFTKEEKTLAVPHLVQPPSFHQSWDPPAPIFLDIFHLASAGSRVDVLVEMPCSLRLGVFHAAAAEAA